MRSSNGGFFSAEDADSEGEEGRFYTWTLDEIRDIIGKNASLFIETFNITEDGNFIEEATREKTKRNIPYLKEPLADLAQKY